MNTTHQVDYPRIGASPILAVLLVLLGSLSPVQAAAAPTPGTWHRGAPLPQYDPNGWIVGSLLQDGRALVAGGSDRNLTPEQIIASGFAAIYDQTAGKWEPINRPVFPPNLLTLLPDGRVLGLRDTSAEVWGLQYSPYSWSTSGGWIRLPGPSFAPETATLLPDGHVLVIGGKSAALFDPVTATWSSTGSMSAARPDHTATLLGNGKVLVVGGGTDVTSVTSTEISAELYDPATGRFSPTGKLHVPRVQHAAALLPNGNVLVAGGWNVLCGGTGPCGFADAELYDPKGGAWTTTGSMHSRHGSFHMTVLMNGQVLVGNEGGGTSAELYDPLVGTWSLTGGLTSAPQSPFEPAVFLLRDGTALYAPGESGSMDVLNISEVYTPPNQQRLASTCDLTLASVDAQGHSFIRVAARDIASGLKSVKVLQASNVQVALPQFPLGSRDPAVTIVTKVDGTQRSTVALQLTNLDGQTLSCDPVVADLVRTAGRPAVNVFDGVARSESTVTVSNGQQGLRRVEVEVNGHRFQVVGLEDGQTRTLDINSALRPGSHNTVVVIGFGSPGSSAVIAISD